MPESYQKIKRNEPATAFQWLERWSTDCIMKVPCINRGSTDLMIREISTIGKGIIHGDPDLLITTVEGKQFYVIFRDTNTFHSMDLPLLVWPQKWGLDRACWIMPVGWRRKKSRASY